MRLLAQILSGLVLLLSLFMGIAILSYLQVLPDIDELETKILRRSSTPETIVITPSASTWSLSRLPLLPWKPVEREVVAVMIENHELARPFQSGLESAVMVQEIFVEGFITRFVALFSIGDLPKRIGPVRSLRPYFIQTVLPWTRFIVHSGGSPEALERVEDNGDVVNFNAIYLEEDFFYRQEGIPAPHDLFIDDENMSSMLALAEEGINRKVELPLYRVGRAQGGSGATMIRVNLYNDLHNVLYEYNGTYERTNGNSITRARPSNLVFVETSIEEIGPFGRLAINTVGSGDILFFRSGKVYPGTWQRASEDDPFEFYDEAGDPFVFAAGQIWFTVLDDLRRVEWE